MDRDITKFNQGLDQLGITLSNEQMEQFILYYEMLVEKNKVMNLTTITEFEDVILKHFLDSLALVKIVDINNIKTLVDVGTGAGFPGIPIRIAFPHIKLTLLDSLNKRIKFLDEVVDKLCLSNVETVHARAEEGGRNRLYREKFDVAVSRAVANLSTLSEYCVPFIRIGGSFISYKAGNVKEELINAQNAIKKLSCKIANTEEFVLPGSDINRALVKIEKVKTLDKSYPRNAGMPSREPL